MEEAPEEAEAEVEVETDVEAEVETEAPAGGAEHTDEALLEVHGTHL